MNSPDNAAWRWNPTWSVESTEPGSATLNAGADRRVAIDGLRPTTLSAMTLWTTTGRVDACDDEQRIVLDRLASIGAAIPPPLLADTVAVVTTGRPGHPAAEAIVDHLQHLGYRIADRSDEATGLVIVVRGSADVPALSVPHLGVDVRLHHTVVIGPYVVPGVTACIGCLDKRTERRWAPVAVPERPAVVDAAPVVAALVAVQVRLVLAGTSPLVNATATWNLELGESRRDELFKRPTCPTCDTVVRTGRVELAHAVSAGVAGR